MQGSNVRSVATHAEQIEGGVVPGRQAGRQVGTLGDLRAMEKGPG